MKKIFIFIILGIITIGIIGATLQTSNIKYYIINNLQDDFNIILNEENINIVNIEAGKEEWDIKYLSYEEGISTDIKTLNGTILEINLTNTNGGGYKFQSVICNITNVNEIEKFEYNPSTNIWTSTGNLQYSNLQYTHHETWCSETNRYGFVLFSSGSKDKIFKLRFPEGEKEIILLTGSGSEKVNIKYSSNLAFINFTSNEIGRKNTDQIVMITNTGNLR